MTDEVNMFFQQILKCRGMLFAVSSGEGMTFEQAESIFMSEIQRGLDSVKDESDWISPEEARTRLDKVL